MLLSLTDEASREELQKEIVEFMTSAGFVKRHGLKNQEIAQKLALKWIASSTPKLPFLQSGPTVLWKNSRRKGARTLRS